MEGLLLGAFVAMVLITVVLKRISRPTVDRLDGEPAILRNVEALNEAAKTDSLTDLERRVMRYNEPRIMAEMIKIQSLHIRELDDRVRYLESLLPPDLSPDA